MWLLYDDRVRQAIMSLAIRVVPVEISQAAEARTKGVTGVSFGDRVRGRRASPHIRLHTCHPR